MQEESEVFSSSADLVEVLQVKEALAAALASLDPVGVVQTDESI